MPTLHVDITNESCYNFNLLGEHFVSASWAASPSSPKSAQNKITAIPPKSTVSMAFVSSFAHLSGAVTFISSGREIPIFIQVAFASPIVGQPTLNARVASQPLALHDFVSSTASVSPASDSAVIEGHGCHWTARSDAARKAPVVTVFVQVEDSLAAGAAAALPASIPTPPNGCFILRIENQSAVEFRFDGDLLSPHVPSLSHSRVTARSIIELNGGWSSSFSEVALPSHTGGCWWYRGAGVDGSAFFLSLAVYTNSLGKTFFYASCGPPPADLAFEYSNITSKSSHKVSKSLLNAAPIACEGCQWLTSQRGAGVNTVVLLKIAPVLKPYNPLEFPFPSGPLKSPDAVLEETASASQAAPGLSAAPLLSSSLASSSSSSSSSSTSSPASTETALTSPDDHPPARNFMDSSRPKNIFGGLASAARCVGAGFVAGGVALFAAPAVGYKENGLKGLAGGIVQGVFGGAAIAAAGVVAGGAQVVRGVVNTPEAVKQGLMKQNMKWDDDLGKWVENTIVLRDLIAAAEEEAKADDAQERTQSGFVAGRSVKETRFYDLLGVAPDTPPAALKKAYYKAAVRCHPDKNPDDPEADAKFQDLSKAYNVLSDDAARARYDELGESGIAEQAQPQFDAMLFFSVLFGSEKFEAYVGDLAIATTAAKMFSNAEKHVAKGGLNTDGAKEEMLQHSDMAEKDKRQQRRRIVRIADLLVSRLATFVQEGLHDEFVTAAYVESQTLVHQSFGPQLLTSIGWVYMYRARKFLSAQGLSFTDGGGMDILVSLKKSRRGASQKLAVGSNIFKSIRAVQSIADSGNAKQKSEMADKIIKPGCYVKISGLVNRPELNQVVGVVLQVEDTSAVIATQGVEGATEVRQLKIKMENLVFMHPGHAEGEDPTKAMLAANMPLLLNTAWSLSALDIESSVSRASKYVTRDVGVPWQTRFKRARALLLLGKVFTEVGAAHSGSSSDDAGLDSIAAMKKVEEALASSVKEKK